MRRLEYKTVAMPQLLRTRRRRGQTRAEVVAEIVSTVINKQAALGWRYAGTDLFKTIERRGLLGGSQETTYTVLVFDREASVGAVSEPEIETRAEPRAKKGREAPTPEPHREPAARGRVEPDVDEPTIAEPRRGAFRFGEGRRDPPQPKEGRPVERRRGDERETGQRDAGQRDAGHGGAREAVRNAARELGRDLGRDPARDIGREFGREPSRDSVREPGRDSGRETARDPGWDDAPEERRGQGRSGRRPVEPPPEPDFGDYAADDEPGFEQPERRQRVRSYGVGGPRARRTKG